jgi:aerotaxis receptor
MNRENESSFGGGVAILQTDLKGNILFANRNFCEVSGYDRDELFGKNQNITNHPDVPNTVYEEILSALVLDMSWSGTLKLKTKNGLYFWADVETIHVRDNNQNSIGYISVLREATQNNIKENEELYRGLRVKHVDL